mmetsp:Transcript_5322/g.6831  ORF Transcript_5322/g.6831 Transcript_5322/m.6831 type:complete len:184 (-) Transcript_5322:503-1054(-)
MTARIFSILMLLALLATACSFAPLSPAFSSKIERFHTSSKITTLRMSDSGGGGGGGSVEKSKSTKKGLTTIVLDKTEAKEDMKEKIEEQWRVVLHNDEVHTFNYVIQSLCKIIGTLDRKRAFDICVLTHGTGKATITKTWKEQAMKYCLGMQRQGLTASIAPESRFSGDGGEGGGDEPDSGKA